jgi:hypothetical protein
MKTITISTFIGEYSKIIPSTPIHSWREEGEEEE